jgi:hypothetical protein
MNLNKIFKYCLIFISVYFTEYYNLKKSAVDVVNMLLYK